MSRSSYNAITAAVAASFATGLFVAGVLQLPHHSAAESPVAAVATPPSSAPVASLVSLSEAFASVAERVKPSVVYIESTGHERLEDSTSQMPPEFAPFFRGGPHPRGVERSSGSGVIVSTDGDILTNAHVVDGADRVTVRLLDRREYRARVVGRDASTDLAVLHIDADHLVAAELGSSDAARVGEWVLAVGNPLGENLSFTVTSGIISAKGRTLAMPNRSTRSIQDFIQTDAAINPGNSGGPLVNVEGQVIGINSAIASETGYYTGYGFAIPINLARDVMAQLEHGGTVHRAALGVSVRDATANDAAYVGLDPVRGVVVQDVGDENSPARKAGIQAGDVIIAVDGKPVDYVGQVQQAVAFRQPGDIVGVEVARKGSRHETLRVKLMAAPLTAEPASARDDDKPHTSQEGTLNALGLTVAPLDQQDIAQLQLPDNVRGLGVMSVAQDGPAAEQVVGPDQGGPDILTTIEGHAVRSLADARQALAGTHNGDVVDLRLYNARTRQGRVERVRRVGE